MIHIDTYTIREIQAMVRSFQILTNLGLISPDDVRKGHALLAQRERLLADSKGARSAEDIEAALDRLIAGDSTVYNEALQVAHTEHAETLAAAAANKIQSQVWDMMATRRDEVESALNEVISDVVQQAEAGFAALGGITDPAQAIEAGLADAWQATVSAERVVKQIHKDADTLRDARLCWSPRQPDRGHWAVKNRRQPTGRTRWTQWLPYVPTCAEEFEAMAQHRVLFDGTWAGVDDDDQ